MRTFLLKILVAGMVLVSGPVSAGEKPRLTAADYQVEAAGKWTVHVQRALDDHPRRAVAVELLKAKLAEVERLLPLAATAEMVKVPVWLSRDAAAGACYHPSADWLRQNGRVVEMARAIEIQNVDHFIDWSPTQPMMVLHELAHAWQDRVLEDGNGNAEIAKAYQTAKDSGIYQNVRHKDGSNRQAYAMTNPMEYFAECTEAWFGTNDFQPFDREELQKFDPAGARMVEKMWGKK
ncbi:MAG: hypothetical protein EOP88_10565 [Verrucomicrobiaceae bacterium]|nr:MAG: hypothetical protein EOP88_10565 [Verrucomicrobiaceae bacterium]